MEHLFGFILCIVCGVFLGIGIFSYIGDKKEEKNEVGYCHIEKAVYCINGELMVENPKYQGSGVLTGDPQSLFLHVLGRKVTPCTCIDNQTKENSELLTDLKETVNK